MDRKVARSEDDRNRMRELEALSREGAEIMKALSHETRLAIVFLVCESEKTVTEIQDALNLPQATISQQLGRLRREKVVIGRRRGRSVRYVAHAEKLGPVLKALRATIVKSD
jgi:DNA-binding transcriptional ArsR family regulator